jgi:hypothetical protein
LSLGYRVQGVGARALGLVFRVYGLGVGPNDHGYRGVLQGVQL